MSDEIGTSDDTDSTSKWSSRKFWLVVGTTLIVTVLLWNSKIDQSIYQNLLYLMIGGYLASNTTQNVMLGKEENK